MTEYRAHNGFTLARTAENTGPFRGFVNKIADLEVTPLVEVRQFDHNERTEPGVHIVRNNDIVRARLPRNIPLTQVINAMLEELPDLKEPLAGITFDEARVRGTRTGEHFITLQPDEESRTALLEEYDVALNALEKVGKIDLQDALQQTPQIDMTVVYASPLVGLSLVHLLRDHTQAELPISVTFAGADFYPDPRLDPK